MSKWLLSSLIGVSCLIVGAEAEERQPKLLQWEKSNLTDQSAYSVNDDAVTVRSTSGDSNSLIFTDDFSLSSGVALEFSALIDPVINDGDSAAGIRAGLSLGMSSATSDPNRFSEPDKKVFFEVREFGDRTEFTITLDDKTVSFWDKLRMTDGKGVPNQGARQVGQGYLLKIVAIPRGETTGLRFFFEHSDRPLRLYNYEVKDFVTEWELPRTLTEANHLGLYVDNSSAKGTETVTEFQQVSARRIPLEAAEQWMPADEFVMANIDYDHPAMHQVKAARDAGDMKKAKGLLIHYFRTRKKPVGPAMDLERARATAHGKESNWREVADNAIAGVYSKLSWFHGFAKPGELSRENGLPRWNRDPGFLNRHFHWSALTYAYETTGESKYAGRVAEELIDWVEQEPSINFGDKSLGGNINTLDGTVIAEDLLWTGNIGRRLEMIWWQNFEILRKTDAFPDKAIFSFLDGVIRQCRLLTNHSVFLEWDDSGFHGAVALVKSSTLFPMADEAALWNRIGWERINYITSNQFHPDGSHVSLSTGYEWATINGFVDLYHYLKKNDAVVPGEMGSLIEEMFYHPAAVTRPNFGTIDVNDGTWSALTDRFERAFEMFPHRSDYEFFATEGAKGEAPDPASMHFHNAGQYLMRTGWGDGEKYLFFGAGPWGASHGKADALNIFTAFGPELLLRSAGHASYSGVGNTVHAGQSLAFNVLSPDFAQENSIPFHKRDMAIGMNPPNRRFVTNDQFDYGEGEYTYGWYNPGEKIDGKWLRQVIFVKGKDPVMDGYYVVIDTVEPATNRKTTWYHPWHLEPNDISINESDLTTLSRNEGAAIRITPVDPGQNMSVEIIRGQEEPALLGWRIHGESESPWPTPTYSWEADGIFTKAWIIETQSGEDQFPVTSVKTIPGDSDGKIEFCVTRSDGSSDFIMRRMPGSDPEVFRGESVKGDVVILGYDRTNRLVARLELEGGMDSVAKPVGRAPGEAILTVVDQFKNVTTSDDLGEIGFANASFENPAVDIEIGRFDAWDFNSAFGTGTWPIARANVKGEAEGDQVAVIHSGGFISQTVKTASGVPVRIAPGKTLRVSFKNLPHADHPEVNVGFYLDAGNAGGMQIASATSFRQEDNVEGEREVFFDIKDADYLSEVLPEGWENVPMSLRIQSFGGRLVIDDIKIEMVSSR